MPTQAPNTHSRSQGRTSNDIVCGSVGSANRPENLRYTSRSSTMRVRRAASTSSKYSCENFQLQPRVHHGTPQETNNPSRTM